MLSWIYLTTNSPQIRVRFNASSSCLPHFFIFFTYRWFCGFTSYLVSELQAWVLGRRNPFTSAFGSFSGADDPRLAQHNCCVGTWNFPTGALLRATVLLWPSPWGESQGRGLGYWGHVLSPGLLCAVKGESWHLSETKSDSEKLMWHFCTEPWEESVALFTLESMRIMASLSRACISSFSTRTHR